MGNNDFQSLLTTDEAGGGEYIRCPSCRYMGKLRDFIQVGNGVPIYRGKDGHGYVGMLGSPLHAPHCMPQVHGDEAVSLTCKVSKVGGENRMDEGEQAELIKELEASMYKSAVSAYKSGYNRGIMKAIEIIRSWP